MNWYIGQDIVAIMDHFHFNKGDEFKVNGFKAPFCKCGYDLIDIGNRNYRYTHHHCSKCNTRAVIDDGILWYDKNYFQPLDPIKEAISQLMEETLIIKQI